MTEWDYDYENPEEPWWRDLESDTSALKNLFERARNVAFPSSSRKNPVGLNPERFIAHCERCDAWLHGYEYGTDLCNVCQEKEWREIIDLRYSDDSSLDADRPDPAPSSLDRRIKMEDDEKEEDELDRHASVAQEPATFSDTMIKREE